METDATKLLSKCMGPARYVWLNMLVVGRKLRQKFRPLNHENKNETLLCTFCVGDCFKMPIT